MDGFESHDNIVVIAATNMVEVRVSKQQAVLVPIVNHRYLRVQVLDAALIRPGRFDVHIHVGLCGERGRFQILQARARRCMSGVFE